jgi:serine/threonine protein kinase/lipopolysaccharide biosynthesis regulator YciM
MEQWATVKRIHQAVLDRAGSERTDFLDEICAGDETLRREVQSLLAYEEEAESFMEMPALEVTASVSSGDNEPTLVGRVLSHYHIVSFLGAGGMGEVYLAQDPRLDRTVALKILPADLASDPDRMQRFTREAKAASALNHPNVAVIHDVGESDGIRFIVMEHVEGQTLATKIAGQALAVGDVIDIAVQVADALDAAHSKGITHRDIKPANLMLTPRGQVKVLDFGIAKMMRSEEPPITGESRTDGQTAVGSVIGSAAHMSPEQIEGREVDCRSDLFSLGVALYEMATGRLPFTGATRAETIERILHAPPEWITIMNHDIPFELERITLRCLEKTRERRYQSARDLLTDLRELRRQTDTAIAAARSTIANDPDSEAARPLEASELVGRGRAHLRSGSLFELPQAVSAFQAASELDPTFAEAYAGLALARCHQATSRDVPHREAFAEAKAAALRALAMDDQSADAQVALGQVLFLSEWDWIGAERSFQRALETNPNHPEAYLHYGGLMEALGRLDRGLQLKQQALERDPTSALTLALIAVSFWNQRRYDDAIAWLTRALDRDPRHVFARELRGAAYFKTGNLEGAFGEDLTQAEALNVPEATLAAMKRVQAEIKDAYEAGGGREAMRCVLKHSPDEPGRGKAALYLAVIHADAGDLDAAFEHLDRALDARDPALVHLAVAPQWDSMRGDPRFNQRLARMRLQPVS